MSHSGGDADNGGGCARVRTAADMRNLCTSPSIFLCAGHYSKTVKSMERRSSSVSFIALRNEFQISHCVAGPSVSSPDDFGGFFVSSASSHPSHSGQTPWDSSRSSHSLSALLPWAFALLFFLQTAFPGLGTDSCFFSQSSESPSPPQRGLLDHSAWSGSPVSITSVSGSPRCAYGHLMHSLIYLLSICLLLSLLQVKSRPRRAGTVSVSAAMPPRPPMSLWVPAAP